MTKNQMYNCFWTRCYVPWLWSSSNSV